MALKIQPGSNPVLDAEHQLRLQEYDRRQKALQKSAPNPSPNSNPEWKGIKLPSPAAGEKLRKEAHERLMKALQKVLKAAVQDGLTAPARQQREPSTQV